jgi:hypothetical protein
VTKRRWIVFAVFAFFFGFPLAGIGWFYYLAHSTMRTSAIVFADKSVDEVLQGRDYETLRLLATLPLRKKLEETEFSQSVEARGEYEGHGEFRVVRSTVGARDDRAWQFVYLTVPVRFSRGEAELSMTAARRSTELGEWRIEDWRISP